MPAYTVLRPARSIRLPIRNQSYHMHVWGEPRAGQVPLVLMHGWMDVGASYQFMVDALPTAFFAERFIIAPDWRGFGLSTGPACDHYFLPDYLGDLDALVDHFSPGAPIDLVGHSMGGNIVMMYAGIRADRIRRLVNLEGFGMRATRAEEAPGRYAEWLDQIRALGRGEKRLRSYADAAAVAARLRTTNPRLSPGKADWLARQWAEPRTEPDGTTRWHIRGDPAHRVINSQLFRVGEQLALYAAITAPLLMIDGSDAFLHRRWKRGFSMEEFAQRLAHVRSVRRETIPEAGHMLHHDQPQILADLLAGFLAG